MPHSQERIAAVDWLKTCAIVAVLLTHAGGFLFSGFGVDEAAWFLRVAWTGFHVPTFLAVSGFLYFSDSPMTPRDLGGRCSRLLIPYFFASVPVSLIYTSDPSLNAFLFQLITGSAHGIYYYVFLSACMTALAFLLSRTKPAAAVLVFAALITYLITATVEPSLRIGETWFWKARNPLYNATYFLGGWICRRNLSTLQDSYAAHKPVWWGLAACGLLVYGFADYRAVPPALQATFGEGHGSFLLEILHRHVYTASVVFCVVALSARRKPPEWVVFVSASTYTIYLYHKPVIDFVAAYTSAWNGAVAVPTLVLVALASTLALSWSGPRILGRYSKWVFGC